MTKARIPGPCARKGTRTLTIVIDHKHLKLARLPFRHPRGAVIRQIKFSGFGGVSQNHGERVEIATDLIPVRQKAGFSTGFRELPDFHHRGTGGKEESVFVHIIFAGGAGFYKDIAAGKLDTNLGRVRGRFS